MAVITDPKTGIIVSAPFKSDQWTDVKRSRRWMTFFMSRVVSDTACVTLPVSPVEGQIVIMDSSDVAHGNDLARYSTELSAWEYLDPWDGLQVKDASGTEWFYANSKWNKSIIPTWVSKSPRDYPSPSSPYDDEFDGDALSGAWTWYKQGGATAQLQGGGLTLTAPVDPDGDTSFDCRLLCKSVPSGDWAFETYMDNVSQLESTNARGGIGTRSSSAGEHSMLAVDLGASYNTLCVNGYYTNSPHDIQYLQKKYVNVRSSGGIYLKIAKTGGNLVYSYSINGLVYDAIYTISIGGDCGFANPDQIVIGGYSHDTGNVGRFWFDYVRRTA
jgi:hypothetical protein